MDNNSCHFFANETIFTLQIKPLVRITKTVKSQIINKSVSESDVGNNSKSKVTRQSRTVLLCMVKSTV